MRSLSIIIPAFNEESRLPSSLDRILHFLRQQEWESIEVLVVDDGSRDGTAGVVSRYRAKAPAIQLLSNPGNRGKGYAVRHGMLRARGEWRLFTDSDLSAPIEELDTLFAAATSAKADVAFGSRALDRSLVSVHQSWPRELSGRTFNSVMRLATGLPFRDTQCGFKLYRAKAAEAIFRRQTLNGFGFDVEDLFIARCLGLQCVEVPIRWANAAGTRVSLGAGLRAFADLGRIRWNQMQSRYR